MRSEATKITRRGEVEHPYCVKCSLVSTLHQDKTENLSCMGFSRCSLLVLMGSLLQRLHIRVIHEVLCSGFKLELTLANNFNNSVKFNTARHIFFLAYVSLRRFGTQWK